ncbi:MAG TPA: class I SAM-dependent methyltransferase [Longimicrobiaceae bacterium]|nr:class I SAM-dependent methyltransferase [Longimicrobiaceae bacterium]
MTMPDTPEAAAARTAAGYDAVAAAYAEHLFRELESKPFDREFLDRFAEQVTHGEVLDLGCGPGHVGRYLHERGVSVRGLDLSEQMVQRARELNPGILFLHGDMRELPFPDASFTGVVAFYSIIHFQPDQLPAVFAEMHRVLAPGGLLALAFHVGTEVRHVDELWGVKTSLDFVFFQPAQVTDALRSAGFAEITSTERPPYDPPVEAQTHRCYMLARRANAGGWRIDG